MRNKARLNAGDLAVLVREVLAKDCSISFQARGNSMYPTIRHGEKIVARPFQPRHLKIGTVVLFLSPDDSLVTHRIVGFASKGGVPCVTLRGDGVADHIDTVPVEQVLAEVVYVVGSAGRVRLALGLNRLLGVAWARTPRSVRFCLMISRIIGRAFFDSSRIWARAVASETG
jgi:signal peptidase I